MTDDAARPTDPGPSPVPYVVTVSWLALLALGAIAVVPALDRMFKEVGLEPNGLTSAFLAVCDIASSYLCVGLTAPLILPAPLLRLPREHASTAVKVSLALAAASLVVAALALGLPLSTLMRRL